MENAITKLFIIKTCDNLPQPDIHDPLTFSSDACQRFYCLYRLQKLQKYSNFNLEERSHKKDPRKVFEIIKERNAPKPQLLTLLCDN